MAKPRKKDPKSKRSLGIDRHTLPRVVFHGPDDLIESFKELASRNRRTITAEILIAMEEHMRASGLWPPKPKEEDEGAS